MKARHTLILLLVFLLLGGLYFGLQWREQAQVEQAQEASKLFNFPAEALESLSITQVGEPATTAVRKDGEWDIIAPNDTIRPQQLLWDRVAEHFAGAMKVRELPEGAGDAETFGLAEPALVVEAKAPEAGDIRLRFGSLEPTQRFRYAQLDDGPVLLIDAKTFFELNRTLEELRHRFLMNDRESPLVFMEFVRIWTGREDNQGQDARPVGEESIPVALKRDAPDQPWRMVEPEEAPANQELAEKLATEIQFSLGRDFVDQPERLEDYGLEPPRARMRVEDAKSGDTQIFEVGELATSGEEGGVYVRRIGEDAVFVIDAQLLMELPSTPYALRERRLFTGEAMKIQRLRYEGPDHSFTLEREGENNWKLVEPELADLNQIALSGYIASILQISAADFLPEPAAAYGLDQPYAKLSFTLEGRETPVEIRLLPDPAKPGTYLATQDTGTVVTIMAAQAEVLMPAPGAFRSRELQRFNKAEARAVDLTLEGTRYLLEMVHEKWIVREPQGMRLQNQTDVNTLLDALSPLFAKGVVPSPSADPAAYGLDAPVAVVSVGILPEGGEPATLPLLTIGHPTEDDPQQRYAAVAGREGVFLISQDLVEGLRQGISGIVPQREDPAAPGE